MTAEPAVAVAVLQACALAVALVRGLSGHGRRRPRGRPVDQTLARRRAGTVLRERPPVAAVERTLRVVGARVLVVAVVRAARRRRRRRRCGRVAAVLRRAVVRRGIALSRVRRQTVSAVRLAHGILQVYAAARRRLLTVGAGRLVIRLRVMRPRSELRRRLRRVFGIERLVSAGERQLVVQRQRRHARHSGVWLRRRPGRLLHRHHCLLIDRHPLFQNLAESGLFQP